jgi:single-strand DNA-binding protein
MYLNKASVIGRMTADPELRYTPSGTPVCMFGVATSFAYDKDGERKEIVEFHQCEVWDRLAESIAEHMTKGNLVYIEGRLKTESWDGECGKKHYRTKIIVERCSFGPKSTKPEAEHAAPMAQDPAPRDDDVPLSWMNPVVPLQNTRGDNKNRCP